MNKRAYYWIKLHTAYLSNIKFLQQTATTKYHYIALYLVACEGDSGGVLVQNDELLSIDEMAMLLRENRNKLQKSIDNLVSIGLMKIEEDGAYSITRFMEDQGKESFGNEIDKKRAQWRERQARHRGVGEIGEISDKKGDE